MPSRSIPEATVSRLPIYLRALLDLAEEAHAAPATSTSSKHGPESALAHRPIPPQDHTVLALRPSKD